VHRRAPPARRRCALVTPVTADTWTEMAMGWAASESEGSKMQLGTTVSVDDDFARFGNKSYAINKINSVEVRARKPFGEGPMFACGILAIICFLSGLSQLTANTSGALVMVLLAGLFGFFAYKAWQKTQIVEYQLFLMTSSSEAQAFVTRDGREVQALRDRIEGAMARKPVTA